MFQSVPLENTTLTDFPHATSVRALLLDDSNFDRARIRRLSQKADMAIDLDEVGTIAELDSAVKENKYDLIMIDYRLPVGDGMEALQHVLDDPRNASAGKIMITGDAAVDTAVRAMRGGCHDFLTKEDMDAPALNQAMLNAMTLARQRQMQELQSAHQREIIREGLVAALSDAEVQGNVVSLVRQQLLKTLPDRPRLMNVMDPGDVDMLLAGFSDEDEFIFH
ncbi:response regulator [Sulfitobacter aestuariivivens]|uniref:Response regulator n=1 Tax=Sulfitobacter aestuariivivens TaxID=2766981 RepID=A0A927D512_9RHOB|nr:response regulator [Sulfitobacter aestuariivivens]MBD3664348.1 response regulator [Sulfitobacter aestuariivivens]